ncbi:hypothetical protein LCGC14_1779210 [marine sediment metagenome]|uniref:Uncharacterized protein n=1 Tax=marine sediment metagenome TaxID=412755 RepID=A0A0F9JVL6_9ZZZZ
MREIEVGQRVVNVWTAQQYDLKWWLYWTFHRLAHPKWNR